MVAAPQRAGPGLCVRPAAGPDPGQQTQANFRSGMGFGLGSGSAPLEIQPADYEAFERLLGDVQAAWSNEDVSSLEKLTTPEMASYFAKDLADNKARNDVNKVSDVKLLQGDLAEAWREGETDYASVAMRFSLVDKTLERSTGKLVAGSEQPIEATEVWTFARRRGNGLGTFGDPADQLIDQQERKQGVAVYSAAPFLLALHLAVAKPEYWLSQRVDVDAQQEQSGGSS